MSEKPIDTPPAAAPPTRGRSGTRVDPATVLAELEAGALDAPAPAASTKAPPAPKTDAEEAPEVELEAEADAAPDAEADASGDGEAGGVDANLDEATSKRLAGVQRAEKRAREQAAARQAAFERDRAAFEREWQPRVEAAQRFEALKERARYAPDAVLEELGLSAEDWEPAARALYARSQAGAKNPANREAAQRLLREREANDKLAAVQRQVEELQTKLRTQEQQAQTQAQVTRYLDGVAKAMEQADVPLVKLWAAKAPAKVRARLHEIAVDLAEASGEVPSPAEVLREAEQRRRADLEEGGIDVAQILGASGAPDKAPPAASAGKKPAKTLGKAGGNAGGAAPAQRTRAELVEDVRSKLLANQLDD
jgi:hypothetical protein